MKRILRAPLIASAFFFFWSGAVVFAWVVFPVLRLLHGDEDRRRAVCQRMQKRAFRLFHGYMRVLGLLRIDIARGSPTSQLGPRVMVANHPTLVDVTALLSIYDGVTCIVKTSLVKNPFVGPLLRACGHIDGGDGEGISGTEAISEAITRLRSGATLLVFPEGTRSPRGGMHRFRRGAFEIASRAQVPIVPVFLTCDPPALSKGLPFWAQPIVIARLAVEELPAIEAESVAGGSKALRNRVEEDLRFRLYSRGPSTKDAGFPIGLGTP